MPIDITPEDKALGSWVGEKYWVSPFNYTDEVMKNYNFPKNVEFYDLTLRDGEQTPGVVFLKEEKLEIAQLLDEVGVNKIEAGMPVVSEEDAEAVKAIAQAGLKAKVFAFGRLVQGDIEAALKCDVYGMVVEGPTGVPKRRQFDWTDEDVIQRAMTAIDYAKTHGLYTTFFSVDMTRADLKFLLPLLKRLATETKVDSFTVVDTFGCVSPEALKWFVKLLKSTVNKPLEMHCHDDFGLGTSQTIAGLSAGADVAQCAVNGIGERCGNVSFEQVALSLKLLYGVKVDIKLEKLQKLSKLVERHSRFKVPLNKPIVGDRAFTREAGISIAGWAKYNIGSESYLPELVGNKHGVVMGKKSGRHSIEWKLTQLGLHAPAEKIPQILEAVKNESVEKKAAIEDDDFKRIVHKVLATN